MQLISYNFRGVEEDIKVDKVTDSIIEWHFYGKNVEEHARLEITEQENLAIEAVIWEVYNDQD